MSDLELFSKIPLPSEEHINRFKKHLLEVHSWYKHLSLRDGAFFVVYLAADLDVEYPSMHPKLPFGNTKEGYEKAFGHLTYMYKQNGTWFLDYDSKIVTGKRIKIEPPNLPEEVLEKCGFYLFPYCHANFGEGITLMEADFEEIKAGFAHPQAELLSAWYEIYQQKESIWRQEINEIESEQISTYFSDEEQDISLCTPKAQQYIQFQEKLWELEMRLQETEIAKVEIALNELARLQ